MLELNTVYNMDCLDGLSEIPNNYVDLICTDPPYFLGMTHNGQKGTFTDLAICKPFYKKLAEEFDRILKPTGEFYIFMDWRSMAFYYPIFDAYLPVKNLIVWNKLSGPGSFYGYCHEFILYGTKNTMLKRGGSNIWAYKGFSSGAKAMDGEKIHPTQKPTEIIKRIITEGSEKNGIVCDPFMGSFTTAVCAERLGRRFIGFEIDEKHFKDGSKRLEQERAQMPFLVPLPS